MHVVVSWDINSPASNNYNHWRDKMLDVLKPYAWVRPLNTFYIVPISSEADVGRINSAMDQISKAAGGAIHFIISPAMIGGTYAGTVPSELWPEINRRSAM